MNIGQLNRDYNNTVRHTDTTVKTSNKMFLNELNTFMTDRSLLDDRDEVKKTNQRDEYIKEINEFATYCEMYKKKNIGSSCTNQSLIKTKEDSANIKESSNKDDDEDNQSESKSHIIVKPDGSRVLLITMSLGGMETTMSIELSKSTDNELPFEDEAKEQELVQDQIQEQLKE